MTKQISVGVVYRNYSPLHTPYFSLLDQPPKQIKFAIPKAKRYLRHLFPVYRNLGSNPWVAKAISFGQHLFFQPSAKSAKKHDVLFFIGMLPPPVLRQNYVIDLEHIYSLLNFSSPTPQARDGIMRAFASPYCKGITPLSQAAAKTVEDYLGPSYADIAHKIQVVYPAIPCYTDLHAGEKDCSLVPNGKDRLNFLFIGKDAFGKGLQEVLPAFHETAQTDERLFLTVISETPDELIKKYRHPRIQFFTPRFHYKDVIKKFFLPSDVFIMPTHSDTFGMVYLDALSAGLPVIATRQFAIPEIVDDSKNGILLRHHPLFLEQSGLPRRRGGKDFLLNSERADEIIQGSINAIRMLTRDETLLNSMKKAAPQNFRNHGKFTIAKRNEVLSQIFLG